MERINIKPTWTTTLKEDGHENREHLSCQTDKVLKKAGEKNLSKELHENIDEAREIMQRSDQ